LLCSWRNSLRKHSSIPVGSCLGPVALSAILHLFREIVIKGLITNWGVKESFQTSVSSHFAMYYMYAAHRSYIEEQWRARWLWHFPLPPEQVQSSSFFTNDILMLEAETLSYIFRFKV
jgi:hypothetical protein